MRRLAVLMMLAIAGPAGAQPYLAVQAREAQAAADAQAQRYREITADNRITALETRLQADQAIGNLLAARASPVPTPRARGDAAPMVIDPRQLVSMPDAALAQSNARIRAAADNRR